MLQACTAPTGGERIHQPFCADLKPEVFLYYWAMHADRVWCPGRGVKLVEAARTALEGF